MKRNVALAFVAVAALLSAGARCGGSSSPPAQTRVEEVVTIPGFQEPHTPGSGAPEEFPTPQKIQDLLGPNVDRTS